MSLDVQSRCRAEVHGTESTSTSPKALLKKQLCSYILDNGYTKEGINSMKRLQLTTTKKVVFLSPFVYDDKTARSKLIRMSWLVERKAEMVAVDVIAYPAMAVYRKDRVTLNTIKMIDRKWKEIEDVNIRKNVEEVER